MQASGNRTAILPGAQLCTFNVGGVEVQTTLATLSSNGGRLYSAAKSCNVSIFIDADILYFRPILNFLRTGFIDYAGADVAMVHRLAIDLDINLIEKNENKIQTTSTPTSEKPNSWLPSFFGSSNVPTQNTPPEITSASSTKYPIENRSHHPTTTIPKEVPVKVNAATTSSTYHPVSISKSNTGKSGPILMSISPNPKMDLLQATLASKTSVIFVEKPEDSQVFIYVYTPTTFRADDPSVMHALERQLASVSNSVTIPVVMILLPMHTNYEPIVNLNVSGKKVYVLYHQNGSFAEPGLASLENAIQQIVNR